MISTTAAFAFSWVCGLVLYKLFTTGRRKKTYPPGPPTVSILGNAHIFPKKRAHIRLTEWSRMYGDIYSLMIGNGVVAVISSYAAVKELLDKQSSITGDRPNFHIGDVVTGGVHLAQMQSNDPNWSLMRKAARSMMTVPKCNEHLPIQRAEAIQFMHEILENPALYPKHAERYTYSVISSVVYGIRAPNLKGQEITDFYHFLDLWNRYNEPGRHPPVDLIPILKYVPMRWALWKREAKVVRNLRQAHYYSLLDRVQKRVDRGASFGAFMEQIVQDYESTGMDRELMASLGGGLLEGGSDTTSSYLKTLRLALVAFPEAQHKAHEEMDRVVGPDRLPELQDIENLPYIRAIIKEVQRWRPPAPLSLPHATSQDAHYGGYVVPRGATIFLNMWAIAHDDNLYENPEKFWPDRYIKAEFGTRDGVDVSAFRHTLGFGGGKRICPGINLANNSIQINTMNLIWAFDFLKMIDSATKRPIDVDVNNYTEALLISPNPFPCDMKVRSPQHAELINQALQESASTFQQFEDILP
ncbi:cytochrome P450 [Dendrothele bispora CBS 962.96]|uniref:Cytochrome P450 n=1 Tax=Dendrothele bispora (strain CBS 962.96) TaxID=1314807 RepID=A0A4S8MJ10_DENBC|nr:cytochrome P450 [Dendrothele bispora CBS 962.96]